MENSKTKSSFRCVLHGSFNKHFAQIKEVHDVFTSFGIEVIAPQISDIKSTRGGFAFLTGDQSHDPRIVELLYLQNLKRLGHNGFSYFVNPDGYIGKSASYELGIAQTSNVPCFFSESISDHPAYLHKNAIWKPEDLAKHIQLTGNLPEPQIRRNEKTIHKLWEGLMVPGSVVAVGGIIEYQRQPKKEKEILLVKTHKWGGMYSMIGGKVRRNERLDAALTREIKEESGLRAFIGQDICAFDQIKDSGYYLGGVQHVFIDKIVRVDSKRVRLNEEAQDYIWIPARHALKELPIEPNARHTVELYSKMFKQF